jgi:hypothetical protein
VTGVAAMMLVPEVTTPAVIQGRSASCMAVSLDVTSLMAFETDAPDSN